MNWLNWLGKLFTAIGAFALYSLGKRDAQTNFEKQVAEKKLEQRDNIQKAQEKIRSGADEVKKKLPNDWSAYDSGGRVRKRSKS